MVVRASEVSQSSPSSPSQVVQFSGAALKAQLAEVFSFGRDEDSDDDARLEEQPVEEGTQGRSGIGAAEGVAAAAKAAAESRGPREPAALRRAALKAKQRKLHQSSSALDGVDVELRAWQGGDGQDDDDDDTAVAKGKPRHVSSTLVDQLIAKETEGKPPAKRRRNKSKKSKKTKGEERLELDELEGQEQEETKRAKLAQAAPAGVDGDDNGAAIGAPAVDGELERPPKQYKRKKKRSKQKNLRKDTRPAGTWLKTLGKMKE